jgi:Ni/Co efflux regulator RcnB
MHKFLLSAAVIGLLAGSNAAFAQDREHHDEPGPRHEEHGDRRGEGQRAPEARHDEGRSGGQFRGRERDAQPDNAMRGGNDFRGRDRDVQPDNAMRGGRPEFGDRGRREERGRDFGTARNFHRNFNAPRHFRAGGYRPPRGYFARRWGWGEILPPAFWARDYWIVDFADYDLPPPPYGAIWVRVGDDALMIDQGSGEIIEVAYGVFY